MGSVYDVVVVGSGAGGGVLAARLSEDPGLRVLLLEAGPDPEPPPDDIVHVRLGSGVASHDWDYFDPATGGSVPRGRVLGGSTAVNATVALRGQPDDYDSWVSEGARGWGWEACLPYFRRLETDADFGGDPWHGSDGPIHIARPLPPSAVDALFEASCAELGHGVVPDQNRPGAIGVGPVPRNVKDWVRQGVAITYLAAARTRPNLEVRADCMVDRVVFSGSRALGVRLSGGERIEARRVVLAGGAYNSPLLLMRSGIGPGAELRRHGVEVFVDRAGVGENLLDHPVTMLTGITENPVDPEHLRFGGMLKTRSRPDLGVDDLKLTLYPGEVFNMPGLTGLYVEVNVARSRGRVTMTSTDPAAPPAFDHRYFSDPTDLDRLVAGVRQAADVAAVMDQASSFELIFPDRATIEDDDQLRDHLAGFHATGYHPSGTCRMGDPADSGTVVDSRLRVVGVEGLYVVDASVMPVVPRCNINLPTMMIGERGAEFVREDL